MLLGYLSQTQIINPVTRTPTQKYWILLTRKLRFKITNKQAGNTFSFYPTSARSALLRALAIDFNIQSYKPSQHLFQCFIAVVSWAGKALMNIKWKGMPQLYTAQEAVVEWNWLLYCASVKEGALLKGRARAAAEYTQHWSVELICSRGTRNPPNLLHPGPKQGGQQKY